MQQKPLLRTRNHYNLQLWKKKKPNCEVGLNYLVGLIYFVLIPGVWEIKQ